MEPRSSRYADRTQLFQNTHEKTHGRRTSVLQTSLADFGCRYKISLKDLLTPSIIPFHSKFFYQNFIAQYLMCVPSFSVSWSLHQNLRLKTTCLRLWQKGRYQKNRGLQDHVLPESRLHTYLRRFPKSRFCNLMSRVPADRPFQKKTEISSYIRDQKHIIEFHVPAVLPPFRCTHLRKLDY